MLLNSDPINIMSSFDSIIYKVGKPLFPPFGDDVLKYGAYERRVLLQCICITLYVENVIL